MGRKLLRFETLESRRLLTGEGGGGGTPPPGPTDAVLVAPLHFPTIELPPGFGTPLPTSIVPANAVLPPLVNDAENLSCTDLSDFTTAHANASPS